MITERPVITKKYVDVEEEVIVEKPVPRRIEKEVITERYVEKPVEVIREVPVERVNYIHKEYVTQKEVVQNRYVDREYETIVEVPTEVIKEVEVKVPVYVDKHIDRTLIKPIET